MTAGLDSAILDLAEKAIRFRSTADDIAQCRACLDLFLDHLDSPDLAVEKREYDGVPSAVVRPRGVTRPRVLLCGHLDVVPGEPEQFEPRRDGDRLYGRGSLDMKGALAAVAEAVRRTAPSSPPWCLLIVSDEEIGGSNGAARLAKENWGAELFVAAEPSELAFSLQSKGALRLQISHRGRRAHASTPWLGDSSVERIMGALPVIRSVIPEVKEESWLTTASLSIIQGGSVINQVPDSCRLSVDIRYVPGEDPDRILEKFKNALPGFEVAVLNTFPPMVCRDDSPLLRSLMAVHKRQTGLEPAIGKEHGATDARYFSDTMDTIIYGPSGEGLHGPSEWVSLSSLTAYAEILIAWAGELLKE